MFEFQARPLTPFLALTLALTLSLSYSYYFYYDYYDYDYYYLGGARSRLRQHRLLPGGDAGRRAEGGQGGQAAQGGQGSEFSPPAPRAPLAPLAPRRARSRLGKPRKPHEPNIAVRRGVSSSFSMAWMVGPGPRPVAQGSRMGKSAAMERVRV
jgi:hypothetical protein